MNYCQTIETAKYSPSMYESGCGVFWHESTLPPELLLEIAYYCVPARLVDLLKITQACRLFRDALLPTALDTLMDCSLRRLNTLPEHLHIYVREVWVSDRDPEYVKETENAWFWYSISRLALPPCIYTQSIHVRHDFKSSPRPLNLTLIPTESGAPILLLPLSLGFFCRVTHLWVHAGRLSGSTLETALHLMRGITHLAVAYDSSVAGDELAAYNACLRAAYVSTGRRKVVLVRDEISRMDIDDFIAGAKWLMRRHEDIYYVAAAGVEPADVRVQWEDVLDGEEDVWQKAERIREAVLSNDRAAVERICGEDYLMTQLKRLACMR